MRTLCKAVLLSAAVYGCLLGISGARAQAPQTEPDIRVEAPALPPGLKWLNSRPLSMADLRGKVVLIDFWEYTCVNCIRTFPYVKGWQDKYRDKGLVIIGVHTPEFQFAREPVNVARAAKDFALTYPLIVDSEYEVWKAYGNRFWPAKYLIDAQGFVRYFHFGEGGYDATEARIQALLKEANPHVELPPITGAVRGSDRAGAVCYPVTPELYVGYERGGHESTLGSKEGYHPNRTIEFHDPGSWQDGLVYASGKWKNGPEALISARRSPSPRDYIGIKYHALEVNSVMKPEDGKPVTVWIYHDGKPVARKDIGADIKYDGQGRSYVRVDKPRMYHLIKNAQFAQRTLKMVTAEPGLGVYSFTFVSCEVAQK